MSDVNVNVVSGLEEPPSDGTTYGRKDGAWVDMTSPANLTVSVGNAAEVAAYTPLEGEPVWDSENKALYVGDGSTQGGIAVGRPEVNAYQGTAAAIPDDAFTNETELSLSGNGTVWQIEYVAELGGSLTDNTNYDFKVGGFTGVGSLVGTVSYINSGDTVTTRQLGATTEQFAAGAGTPAVLKVSGIAVLTAGTGTIAFGVRPEQTEFAVQVGSGLARSAAIARRIA